jgi:putative PIG3 family NAD(P)H quinone oxidoreductase
MAKTMKAILLSEFGGPEVITFGDAEMPEANQGQVLIKVLATSVNKPDMIQRQGNYAPPPGDSEILGLEVAGIIESTGPGVSQWKQGDRVFALIGGGGYAQYAVAHANHCMEIPEHMTFNQAACICETYITAYLNLFLIGNLDDGEAVLLHGGGGGVNTAAIHLCKQLVPNSTVIVTASTGKLERVSDLGADHVIDYKNQDFADAVSEVTGGRGVDVILDHIGAPYLDPNMKSLAIGGRMLAIGVTGGTKAELNIARMMVKRQRVIGSVLRPRSVEEKGQIIDAFRETVMPLFADGRIEPLISDVFPLQQARLAHEAMEASRHFGKIVLEVQH